MVDLTFVETQLETLIAEKGMNIHKSRFLKPFALMPQETPPLFFYHTPKASGNALIVAIQGAYLGHAVLHHQNADLAYNRFDVLNAENALARKLPFKFIASHLPFGVHHHFNHYDYDLMACLRDPVTRVKSAYAYEMMRQDWTPEADDFQDYIKDPSNQNITALQFAGIASSKAHLRSISDDALFELALENLDQCRYVLTSKDIHAFIEYFISAHGLPNVISTRMNVTLPKYIADFSAFDDQIAVLNQVDLRLFEHISKQGNREFLKQEAALAISPFHHPAFALCFDIQSSVKMEGKIHFAHEDNLEAALLSGNHYDDFQSFCQHEIIPRNKA
ncbi:MAG: hypothetical protein AB8B77_01755 [Alphaproteobacteria bacterium]